MKFAERLYGNYINLVRKNSNIFERIISLKTIGFVNFVQVRLPHIEVLCSCT